MNVLTTSWQLAGDGSDASLVMQNIGTCTIGFVFASSQPAEDAYDYGYDDSDDVFKLLPGSEPVTIKDLDTYTKNVYVRAMGPIAGKLAVEANT